MFHGRNLVGIVVATGLVLAASGIAIASVPDADGTVQLCYSIDGKDRPSSDLRVVEPGAPGDAGGCKKNERALDLHGPELPTGCTAGQVAKFTDEATGWECADDLDTTYSAGEGVDQAGTTFAADFDVVQRRVQGACSGGAALTRIHPDGTADCARISDGRVVTPGLQQLAPGQERVLADAGAFRILATCTATDGALILRHVSGAGVLVVADNRTTKVGQILTSGDSILGRATTAATMNRGNFSAGDRTTGKTLDGSYAVAVTGGACQFVFSAMASG